MRRVDIGMHCLVGIAPPKLADIWRRLAEEGVLTEVGVLPAEAG